MRSCWHHHQKSIHQKHLAFRHYLPSAMSAFRFGLGCRPFRLQPNWAVLSECAHEPLQFYWFRAAIWFCNGLLSSNRTTLKQTLHADLKLVPRVKTSWASDILRAFEGLRGCDTYTQAFLQGLPICYSDFTADLRFRMRKVWRDIAGMNPLESDNKLITYHSWFACPLSDLQADSRTRVPP